MLKDVKGIGKKDDLLKVKEGFARNYLLPRNLAVIKNEAGLRLIEQNKKNQQLHKELEKKNAFELAHQLQGRSFNIIVDANNQDVIYASISKEDIARVLEGDGFNLKSEAVLLDEPIKKLGVYDIDVKIHPEVNTKIKLWVVRK